MKKIITILDGALDDFLTRQTPLIQADLSNLNQLLRCGEAFRLRTVLAGEDINSSNANMTILGVDNRAFVPGRPALEALAIGLNLPNNSYVYRLNLLCLDDSGCVVSTVGGGVLSGETEAIKAALQHILGPMGVSVYDLYEHAFLLVSPVKLGGLNTSNIAGQYYHGLLNGQAELSHLVNKIETAFLELELNVLRAADDIPLINSALIWGESSLNNAPAGSKLNAAVITATPIVKGLAKYKGYDVFTKPEFTGDEHSDIKGKADLTLQLLANYDVVFCHIDGLDYVSHKCERSKKIDLLENIDKNYFGTLIQGIKRLDDKVQIIVLPDHGTSSLTGSHIYSVVPGFKTRDGNALHNDGYFDENLAKEQPVLSPKDWIEIIL